MYYRRKLILGLLQKLDRSVPRTDFQKILFLMSQKQKESHYDFVPYKYGCFSFQLDADKRTLTKYGLVKEDENWRLSSSKDYFAMLRDHDRQAIGWVIERVRGISSKKLIQDVYKEYPYYAINSEIADHICSEKELKSIRNARPEASGFALFTLGYEGRSFEQYLNILIAEEIVVLCDVRKNAISRKLGFSKRLLSTATARLGIEYRHMPELGIDSHLRKVATSQNRFRELFDHYSETVLPVQTEKLIEIEQLVANGKRVALTCFEACHDDCHRSRVVTALAQRPGWNYSTQHL